MQKAGFLTTWLTNRAATVPGKLQRKQNLKEQKILE